jgi:hypothetical protein
MPTPFGDSNMHSELADGELYTLDGQVVVSQRLDGVATVYFAVDLTQAPWLANRHRVAEPYYPLRGKLSFWLPLNQHAIRLTAQAVTEIVDSGFGQAAQVISLEPVLVVRE